MGEVSRALGMGSTVEFEGKTYRLAPWTYKIQAQVEEFFQEQAWRAVEASRRCVSPDTYKEATASVARDIASGTYSFGSEVVARGLQQLPGLKYLIYLMISENHPEVGKGLTDRMVENDLTTLMAKVNEATADPTRPPETPAERAADQTAAA